MSSQLEQAAQFVSQIVSDSQTVHTTLTFRINDLKRLANLTQSVMEGTSRPEKQSIFANLAAAQRKLEEASNLVNAGADCARRWLNSKVNGGAGGSGGGFGPVGGPGEAPGPYTGEGNGTGEGSGNGAGGSGGFDRSNASDTFNKMVKTLDGKNVEHRPIERSSQPRSESEIISSLGGNDPTSGSCSSQACAYLGNKAGYDVHDYRDGDSRDFFATAQNVKMLAGLAGDGGHILYGLNDINNAHQMFDMMESGKEYYFASGEHAAIIRLNPINGLPEYLELQQNSSANRWYYLDDTELQCRFHCHQHWALPHPSFLIDGDALTGNPEFLEILGYLNTSVPN